MVKRPIEPVKPIGMELVFFYTCPYCQQDLPTVSPLRPTMLACSACHQSFPIVPIDEFSVQFVKIMLGEGSAAIDQDFL